MATAEAEPRQAIAAEAKRPAAPRTNGAFPTEGDADAGSTPPDLRVAAVAAREDIVPKASKAKYEKTYDAFAAWCKEKAAPIVTLNVLIAYFEHLKDKYAPPTLWSTYSKLKKVLLARGIINMDDKPFKIIKSRIKSFGEGYEPKQSLLFTLDEVYRFCREAPDDKFLCMKVIALIGMCGALRGCEVYNLAPGDIQVRPTELLITIRAKKVKRRKTFICTQHAEAVCCPVRMYARYIALRPSDAKLRKVKNPPVDSVFLRYEKGKCMCAPLGKNTIGDMPAQIAAFLKLATPEKYTGHAFRRTGATSAVANGASIDDLMRLGDWRSPAVARHYVDEGEAGMRKRAGLVQGFPEAKLARVDEPAASVVVPSGVVLHLHSCVINNLYAGGAPK